ncbi:MAG: hypothetical protein M3O33_11710 [Cyanobacteriota bacterium]|nr:hypothetical protein [Cyanobacteriota bacterium]
MPFFVVCVWRLSTPAVKEGYLLRQAGVAEVAEVAGSAQEEKRGLAEQYWLSAQNTNATNLY